ncbi:MAG: hypothetical protein P4L45_16425 [Ignavibacteriaceae bacterium]|nr:hypothetical protein [Ignavibacteriaceae bacterium]
MRYEFDTNKPEEIVQPNGRFTPEYQDKILKDSALMDIHAKALKIANAPNGNVSFVSALGKAIEDDKKNK